MVGEFGETLARFPDVQLDAPDMAALGDPSLDGRHLDVAGDPIGPVDRGQFADDDTGLHAWFLSFFEE
jgi:hypothetical protein